MRSPEWSRWLKSLAARGAGPRRRNVLPRFEELETRLAPASHTWSGADAANNTNPSSVKPLVGRECAASPFPSARGAGRRGVLLGE